MRERQPRNNTKDKGRGPESWRSSDRSGEHEQVNQAGQIKASSEKKGHVTYTDRHHTR